jgi:pimeloyl-ACP methyl ester carboxylesterase
MNANVQMTGLHRVTHSRGRPMLLLAGRHDWLASEDEAGRIATEVAGAQVVVFKESGQFPFLEEPARFVAAVEQWLARLPDASSAGR